MSLNPLTSFRFAAAFAVFLHHMTPLAGIGATKGMYEFWFHRFGSIGVTFFFVLSGFILIYSYGPGMRMLRGKQVWDFLIARIGRVVPLHLLLFVVAAVVLFTIGIHDAPAKWGSEIWKPAIFNVFLLQAWIPDQGYNFAFNGPSWTLSDEMFFYAAFPVAAFIGMKAKPTVSVAKMVIGLVAMWAVAVGLALSLKITSGVAGWFFAMNPTVRLFDFISGMSAGLIFLAIRDRSLAGDRPPLNRHWFSLLEVASLGLLLFSLWLGEYLPLQLSLSLGYLPAMIAVISVFAWQRGIISSLVSKKPLLFLGEISFAFYMWHKMVFEGTIHIGHFQRHQGQGVVFCLVATLALSALTYWFFETPMRKVIRNWGRKRFDRRETVIVAERSQKPAVVTS